ncbi:MAG: homocitrate synthase [Methanomassiliicoccales archaeon]|nr:homocitrate synthase [Methanomassiliicoccales archaeon]
MMKDKQLVIAKLSKSPINICDTTLRDGEQAAGIVFANIEKIRIAKLLDEIGVQQIEAGIPAMGGDEKKCVKKIAQLGLNASVLGWNRANIEDISHSIDCDVDAVAVSMSSSDIHIEHKLRKTREWVIERLVESIEYAKSHGLYISANAEDASRADKEFLIQFAKAAEDAGADRLRYCDTLGILEPRGTFDAIASLIKEVDLEIEMHTHNDFGMATANAIAGVQAGATFVSTTVLGIGERTGNAPLEEIVMAAKHLLKIDTGIETQRFREIAEYVARAAGRTIPDWKPIVGSNCFAHEAGIHTDGVMKYLSNYEPYSPEEVGMTRKIIIGKHSGRHTIIQVLRSKGIEIDEKTATDLLELVRATSIALKRSLSENELVYIYQDYKAGMFEKE